MSVTDRKCGRNLRKVDILLKAIDELGKDVEYYALDLSYPELHRTLSAIPKDAYKHIKCFGLLGTYDDGLSWMQSPQTSSATKVLISLGSSIGNFTRPGAADFIRGFADCLGNDDVMLVGIDGCQDPVKVHRAYNDSQNTTHKFTLNGLSHANKILGETAFDLDQWQAIGEYDGINGKHQAFVTPLRDSIVCGSHLAAGEKIRIEESHKFDGNQIKSLWHAAGVGEVAKWSNGKGDYGEPASDVTSSAPVHTSPSSLYYPFSRQRPLASSEPVSQRLTSLSAMHMIAKNNYAFPWAPEEYAAKPVPSWSEWQHLWGIWDTVTRQMISDEELLEKPIRLRNACIFYLGHIPTFLDMKLANVTNGILTEPKYYPKIFERGIDPDVENPEHCHAHSEVPNDWPPLDEILVHQSRVRERVKSLYDCGQSATPLVGRCLWLGFEHECMHLETLLYMLIQSEKTLPPPSTPHPNFEVMAEQAKRDAVPNEWFKIMERTIKINMDDPETEEGPARYFGWDCEKPSRKVHVKPFEAKGRPITNGEYAIYLQHTGKGTPASWGVQETWNGHVNGHVNGHGAADGAADGHVYPTFTMDKFVRTVYGPVPLSQALHWPVAASYDELTGCAAYMGGRIPTLEEARSIYAQVNENDPAHSKSHQAIGRTIPAVNSHLVNNGVPESPPSEPFSSVTGTSGPSGHTGMNSDGSLDPNGLFEDLKGRNIGFQQWYPTAVTQNGGRLSGQGDMGGLWEWTSSPMLKHEGFRPMRLYEAYSRKRVMINRSLRPMCC